jgi:hypothetical protein
MSGIQAKNCLPPSRPSLTSYALKTRGALRRLGFLALDDLISNDLMPLRGLGSIYIAQSVQREPLDQTNLKDGVDAILGGGGGMFQKMLTRGAHRGPSGTMVGLIGPTWQPLRVCLGGRLLESSRVVFVAVKFSYI